MMTVVKFPEPDWREGLQQTANHTIRGNLFNAARSLRHAPELAGAVRLNEFGGRTEISRALPWSRKVDRDWIDADTFALVEWLQAEGMQITSRVADEAVALIASENAFHPVRDFLEGAKWDPREPKLDDWLNSCLGVGYRGQGHKTYVQAVSARWLVAAVARIMDPGCKVDTALILEGEQGRKKSTGLEKLFSKPWFSDQISDLGSKDAAQDLRGKWGFEFPELKNIRGQDVEKIKAFLSRSVDHYRPSHERRSQDFPRQCVFAGSTNEDIYLHDKTGNRRFWPVKVGPPSIARIEEIREALWAEARDRYRARYQWWLTEAEGKLAVTEQASRTEDDTWTAFVMPWLAGRAETTTREVLVDCLQLQRKDINRAHEMRIGQVLREAGFRSSDDRHPEYGSRIYRRQGTPA